MDYYLGRLMSVMFLPLLRLLDSAIANVSTKLLNIILSCSTLSALFFFMYFLLLTVTVLVF